MIFPYFSFLLRVLVDGGELEEHALDLGSLQKTEIIYICYQTIKETDVFSYFKYL